MKVLFALSIFAFAAGAKELRFAIAGDPRTFDPLQVVDSNSETIRYLTGGVLVRIDRSTGELRAELAESWKVTDGGRSVSFHLRPGLKFSDGSALDANDAARTLRRALDPKEASPVGDAFRSGAVNPEITVAGPLDLTIRYKAPRPSIDRLFDTLAILPRTNSTPPSCAGPYRVAEYRAGDHVRLERNPNYWKQPPPRIDSIRIDIQQNRDIELRRFLRGELDLIGKLDPESFDRLAQSQPAAARNLGASLDSEFLWFNQSPAPSLPEYKRQWFRSASFRHAVSAAIHRDDLVRVVFRGHAHAALGPISPANKFWFNTALKRPASDPARLLAAEGFTKKDGVLHDKQGNAVEFSLITQSGNRARERIAALVQNDLSALGIRVNIVTLEFGSLLERIGKTLNYEAALLGFANVEEDPSEEMNVWLSSGAQHAWWPAQKMPATPWEAEIDKLELRQAGEPDRAARKRAVDEVQRIAAEQEPIIYLVNPDYLCAISPRLKDVKSAVIPPQILWNVESLRLE